MLTDPKGHTHAKMSYRKQVKEAIRDTATRPLILPFHSPWTHDEMRHVAIGKHSKFFEGKVSRDLYRQTLTWAVFLYSMLGEVYRILSIQQPK